MKIVNFPIILTQVLLIFRHGHQDCVRLLLSRGAQLLRTNDQETPLDIAVKVRLLSHVLLFVSK